MKLKILHYADIQIEIRVSGQGAQRLNEFADALGKIEAIVNNIQPDIIIIAGDIFEFAESNGDEQKMFARHLHAIKVHTKRIVIIPGNHDIKQKNNGIIDIDEKRNIVDSIDSIVTAVNDDKISYYKHSGIYKDSQFPLSWAVWSQINKHSAIEPKPAYSPWIDDTVVTEGALIELFHDPLKGAKDFSGQPSEHFLNYGISLADFKANTIIAGDIHNPDIIWWGVNNEKLFTYSSSLVQRNYGESDYFSNLRKIQSGNAKHGYNIIEFDTDLNKATSCQFIALDNVVSRHTIRLTSEFNYDTMIPALEIDSTAFNKIRVICHGNLHKFLENESAIIEHLRSRYNCSVETDWAKDVIDIQVDESEFENLEQVLDKSKILEISKKYIESIVDKTTTISKDDKEAAKEMIYAIFEKEMSTADLTSTSTYIKLLDAEFSNFMTFSENVKISFKDNEITVISGTNGVGKTNIFHFLKWIYCDQISELQNARNKKYNYSLYFNDTSELDEVNGQIRFLVNNNNPHVVTKKMTRTWKKNTKDIYNQNWIDNLTGTPSIQLSITSNDFNSDNTEECQTYLNNLITLKELNRLVFVDGSSLTRLINTKSEDLSSEFLTILGLDVMNTILETFEDVKNEKLDKLAKPTMSIEDALTSITNIEITKVEHTENVKTLTKQLENDNIEVLVHTDNINTKLSSLHQVDTEIVILEKIKNLNDGNASIDTNILASNESINDLNLTKEQHSLETITSEIHAKELELIQAKNILDNHDTKVISDKKEIESLKLIIATKAQEAKSTVTDKINVLVSSKDRLNIERNDIVVKKANNFLEYQNKITVGINALNTLIATKTQESANINVLIGSKETESNSITHKITAKELIIQNNLSSIQTSKTSKTCTSCGQAKTGEAIIAIEHKIRDFEIENHNEQLIINQFIEDKEKLSTDIKGLHADKLKLDTSITDLASKRDDYSKKLTSIDSVAYPDLAIIEADLVAAILIIDKKLETIDSEVKLLQDSILTVVQSDASVKEAMSNVTLAQTILSTYELTRDNKVLEVSNVELTISEKIALKKTILDIDSNILDIREKITVFEESKKQNTSDIIKLYKDIEFDKLNVLIRAEIETIRQQKTTIESSIKLKESEINLIKNELSQFDTKIQTLTATIEEIKIYKLSESSLKLYKKLLGKNGLPQYIFAHLIPLINKKLNDTLDGVDFRLLFDQESLELRFIDLKKNVSRPVQFVSGMQETTIGLALIHIFRILNNSKKFNILMIDEISGKLNDGEKLTYKAKNYKKIITDFIHNLSKTVNIYIVDHVLHFHDARIIEVQPTDSGAIIVEL